MPVLTRADEAVSARTRRYCTTLSNCFFSPKKAPLEPDRVFRQSLRLADIELNMCLRRVLQNPIKKGL